jgi:hypothetical protein
MTCRRRDLCFCQDTKEVAAFSEIGRESEESQPFAIKVGLALCRRAAQGFDQVGAFGRNKLGKQFLMRGEIGLERSLGDTGRLGDA